MKKYIDTHAHYGHKIYGKDGMIVLEQMTDCCEKIIQVGTKKQTNIQVLELVSKYEYVYGIVGFFPTDTYELERKFCKEAYDNWFELTEQLQHRKFVAIGEIGLDYKWNQIGDFLKGNEARKIQQKWFVKQLDLAQDLNLPVCIHSRESADDTMRILDMYEHIPGVIHCFAYDRDFAARAIEKGLYLGIGGTSAYPSNQELREVIKEAPLERLLLETDCPYLSPQPVRHEINNSSNIKYVIENIASIKEISCDDVVRQTNQNSYKVFPKLKNS